MTARTSSWRRMSRRRNAVAGVRLLHVLHLGRRGAEGLLRQCGLHELIEIAVEHLAQYRGGICFCVDLDPRWVIKLIKKGWMEHLKAYQEHVIDQAMTVLSANHEIKCMFTTPKLLESLATALEKKGTTIREQGITGIFSGGRNADPPHFCHSNLGFRVALVPK